MNLPNQNNLRILFIAESFRGAPAALSALLSHLVSLWNNSCDVSLNLSSLEEQHHQDQQIIIAEYPSDFYQLS